MQARPPTPPAPSPLALSGEGEDDPELSALPAPPRRDQKLTAAVMVATMLASALLAFALRGEVRYALSPAMPLELGDLSRSAPPTDLENRYVRATGLIATVGAIRYERLLEGDSFRLAPLAGNPKVWIEIRVPEGMEGPKFAPPTSFVGRLVPFGDAGVRHAGLERSVAAAGGVSVPKDAMLLIDGASPRASRWSIAMVALLGYFAIWNAIGLLRIFKPVRDAS